MDTTRVENAAEAIRDMIDPNFAVYVNRDRAFLGAVCEYLKLPVNDVNFAQISAALRHQSIAMHDEYPKVVYPRGENGPSVTVANVDEEITAMAQAGVSHRPVSHKEQRKLDKAAAAAAANGETGDNGKDQNDAA